MKREELAEHFGELNFTPQDTVRWLSPGELSRAGIKTLLSSVFADYADKREIQNSFDSSLITFPERLIGPGTDLWFDYTADTGDGFDATFTVASLLGKPELRVEGLDEDLPRGRLLVLGGDEVYPTASARAYEDRLIGPFRAGLPSAQPQPLMLALPGNHDWYDGLTAFLRVFTHERSIGGWRTVQPRSYFTVQLPHRWWLVGLDSQLNSYFDDPQIKYFNKTLTANLQPGDGVILCSAAPTWIKTAGDPDAFNGLDWFERTFVRSRRIPGTDDWEPTGAEVRLFLTGDKHHYARYVEDCGETAEPGVPRMMVTCGLGGAYSSATHDLEPELHLLPHSSRSWRDGDGESTFRLQPETYPSISTSRKWATRVAVPFCKQWLVTRNPGLVSLVGGVHLALFSIVLLVYWQGVGPDEQSSVFGAYLNADAKELFTFAGELLAVAGVAALVLFAPMLRRRPPLMSVAVTALVITQLLVVLVCFVGFGLLPHANFQLLPDWIQLSLGAGIAALVGGLVGASTFGGYIVLSKSKSAQEWAFSGQSIDDGKGFLRLKLDASGTLTVYPLVVDQVHRDFEVSPQSVRIQSTRPSRIPIPVGDLPVPRLIEQPYTIRRTAPKA